MSLQLNPDMILAGSMGEHRLAKDQAAGQGIATKGDKLIPSPPLMLRWELMSRWR